MSVEYAEIVRPTKVCLSFRDKRIWKPYVTGHDSNTIAVLINNQSRLQIIFYKGPEREPFHIIDLKLIKSCIITADTTIEIQDKDGIKKLIEFLDCDEDFVAFHERLVTLLKLLGIKFRIEKPKTSSVKSSSSVSSASSVSPGGDGTFGVYDTVEDDESAEGNTSSGSIHRESSSERGPLPPLPNRDSSTSNWPTERPPPPPSPPPRTIERRKSAPVRKPPEDDGVYLVPITDRLPKTAATLPLTPKRDPPREEQGWTCSVCTLENLPRYQRCNACQRPRGDPPTSPNKKNEKPVENRPRVSDIRKRESSVDECYKCKSVKPTPCPRCKVENWRCKCCTYLNQAGSFICDVCKWTREDAWQCHVCNEVISMNVSWCFTCDVWRCQLCSCQNDARENGMRNCKMCGQITSK